MPFTAPTAMPTASAATMPSQAGAPDLITTPPTTAAIVALPGMDRSSAPLSTPKPTAAAKTAVRAAAFAMRAALPSVKK